MLEQVHGHFSTSFSVDQFPTEEKIGVSLPDFKRESFDSHHRSTGLRRARKKARPQGRAEVYSKPAGRPQEPEIYDNALAAECQTNPIFASTLKGLGRGRPVAVETSWRGQDGCGRDRKNDELADFVGEFPDGFRPL
ncbi:hypothetical protein QTH89_03730 [Variovorax sp. J22G21]|uniref:hypothetical protein n=1 Tax=Variovorax fucosicus TaxID=3053517 RepID=UPI0025762486|nr:MULTISPECIES: hypothetical protein [unclassified Variovorax]MDM0041251.1 hypothetical protein [Variovorax sp. J22R193]MDM0060308.1 hypothetical protein [Variovorax sp. J22G21]